MRCTETIALERSGESSEAMTKFLKRLNFFLKAAAVHNIEFHLLGLAVNSDLRSEWLKIGGSGSMWFLVIGFDLVIGDAAIDKLAIHANTHDKLLILFPDD